jgi:hypothetical protein
LPQDASAFARSVDWWSFGSLDYSETMTEQVKGPASYFPSIEKKYGQPIDHWMKQLEAVNDKKHMEQVKFLQENFEMGQGHANAIVHVYRSKNGLK